MPVTTNKTGSALIKMETVSDPDINDLLAQAKLRVSSLFVSEEKTSMKSFFKRYKSKTYYRVFHVAGRGFDRQQLKDDRLYEVQLFHWGGMKFAVSKEELKAYLFGLMNNH